VVCSWGNFASFQLKLRFLEGCKNNCDFMDYDKLVLGFEENSFKHKLRKTQTIHK
jgi:hypothetical protein